MRLVSYNIRLGGGRRAKQLGETVAALRPDVLVLQEATLPRVVRSIAGQAEMPHVHHRPGMSIALVTRRPTLNATWHRPLGSRNFLEFEIEDFDLRFIGLHLPAGLSRRGEAARLRNLAAILAEIGREADDRTVLIGDLNATGSGDEPDVAAMPRWLRILLRFDGGIQTDVMDQLAQAGWVDAFRQLHPSEPGYTLPAAAPQVRLDYVLVPAAVLPRIKLCQPGPPGISAALASDHLPLIVEIEDAAVASPAVLSETA